MAVITYPCPRSTTMCLVLYSVRSGTCVASYRRHFYAVGCCGIETDPNKWPDYAFCPHEKDKQWRRRKECTSFCIHRCASFNGNLVKPPFSIRNQYYAKFNTRNATTSFQLKLFEIDECQTIISKVMFNNVVNTALSGALASLGARKKKRISISVYTQSRCHNSEKGARKIKKTHFH